MSHSETPPGMPRWVKVFVIILIVLLLLVGGLMLFGGGSHDFGDHAPGMLTGSALLAFCRGPRHPASGDDTVAGDVIPSKGGH